MKSEITYATANTFKILDILHIRFSLSVSCFYTPTQQAQGKPTVHANAGQKTILISD